MSVTGQAGVKLSRVGEIIRDSLKVLPVFLAVAAAAFYFGRSSK